MKFSRSILLFFLCVIFYTTSSQTREMDSLKKVPFSNVSDSLKIRAYYVLGYLQTPENKTAAMAYLNKAIKLAEKTNNNFLIAESNRHKGHYYLIKLIDYSNALKYYNIAVEYHKRGKYYENLVHSYNEMARLIYEPLGLEKEELEALKNCVHAAKKTKEGATHYQYYVLGWFETNMGETDSALLHLKESYKQILKIDKGQHKEFSTELLTWIGNAYGMKKNYRKSLATHLRCAEICDSLNYDFGLNDCYRYIGNTYAALKQYDSAIFYTKKCTDFLIKNKVNNRKYFIGSQLIRFYIKNKDLKKAEEYIKILTDTTEFNYKKVDEYRKQMDIAQFNYHREKGDYKEALKYLADFHTLKDSLDALRLRANLGEQNLKFEFQKQQEIDKLDQQRKDFEAKEKLEKQENFIYAMIGIVIFIAILLILSYKIIKQKQFAFKEISIQKEEVEKQKALVDSKNQEIHDSINYAKRLQDAILPNKDYLSSHFKESYIFYKPKDIVAGDFYFFEKNNDHLIIAAADCTGHGVPGALVSVVCSNALNRSIKEFNLTDPGRILDKTRELVIETFEKSKSDVKDGMDISLISFQRKTTDDNNTIEILWSGANNPLWYIQNNALKVIKPHKEPIGKTDHRTSFPTHQISLNKGDSVYLITDGFADQFGGPKGKKFKYKNLQSLLLNSAHQTLAEQFKIVDRTFNDWKGDLEQVDDVTLIALRF